MTQFGLRLPSRDPGLVLALRAALYDSTADEQGFALSPTSIEAFHVS